MRLCFVWIFVDQFHNGIVTACNERVNVVNTSMTFRLMCHIDHVSTHEGDLIADIAGSFVHVNSCGALMSSAPVTC